MNGKFQFLDIIMGQHLKNCEKKGEEERLSFTLSVYGTDRYLSIVHLHSGKPKM